MKFIIYSGGGNGYNFYAQSSDFPEKYKEELKKLYTQTALVSQSNDSNMPSFRFAPLLDKYLFSVYFRKVSGNGENRMHSASVNWLLSPTEADNFLSNDLDQAFGSLINKSKEMLIKNDYLIDYEDVKFSACSTFPTPNTLKAMFSAIDFGLKVTEDTSFSTQVYLGIDSSKESFIEPIVSFLKLLPPLMKKHLSFYVGARNAVESYGVALTVFEQEYLDGIISSNNYSGAMSAKKLLLTKNEFKTNFWAEGAECFEILTEKDFKKLNVFFMDTDNWEKYVRIIKKIYPNGIEKSFDFEFIDILGDELCVNAVKSKIFTEPLINELYRQKKKLAKYPKFKKAIETSPYIKEQTKKETDKKSTKKSTKSKKTEDKEENKKIKGANKGKSLIFAIISLVAVIVFDVIIYFGFVNQLSKNAFTAEIILLTVFNLPLGYILISSIKNLFRK